MRARKDLALIEIKRAFDNTFGYASLTFRVGMFRVLFLCDPMPRHHQQQHEGCSDPLD